MKYDEFMRKSKQGSLVEVTLSEHSKFNNDSTIIGMTHTGRTVSRVSGYLYEINRNRLTLGMLFQRDYDLIIERQAIEEAYLLIRASD